MSQASSEELAIEGLHLMGKYLNSIWEKPLIADGQPRVRKTAAKRYGRSASWGSAKKGGAKKGGAKKK